MGESMFPPAVFTIWAWGLGLTLVVFVPLSVYLLHRLWLTARSIQLYAREALEAAGGIAGNTVHIPALDATIGVASEMLATAGPVAEKLDTIASVMEARAR
jgi:hypothetical protein